jgi:NAD(P)-dependent dehydrogenase (short-subunit alcohol dehydrogenase family)
LANVLVTGASGGIGQALCRQLRADGETIYAWDVAEPPDAEGITYVQVDHCRLDEVRRAVTDLPELDHVVLLAGRALPVEATSQSLHELPAPETFAESVELNLVGHYTVIHEVLPLLRSGASITVTSSINSRRGYGLPAYSSAKAGLHGLVMSLAPLLGASGVRINAVDFGTVRTAASEAEWAHEADHFERLREGAALGRLTADHEAALAFTGIMHSFPSSTGTIFTVDAGQSLNVSTG